MFLCPIHRQRTAIGQHDDQWFSRGGHGFEELLLWRRKIQINPVSSEKAGNDKAVLFSLQTGRKADNSDNHISFARRGQGAFLKIRRLPKQVCRRFPPTMHILDTN